MYNGKTKLIMKYLGFLVSDYNLEFSFQSFPEYIGFYGPIDCYSFYNDNGCFTLHNVVQRGEWGVFISQKFSTNQYELLGKEIPQKEYKKRSYYTTSGWLKEFSQIILNEVKLNSSLFSIKI